jgi:hypothetical protein
MVGQCLQALEAAAFQRVRFHVPAAAFGDPVTVRRQLPAVAAIRNDSV